MVQMVRRNNYNADKLATEFGIQVQERLVLVEARVLPPPEVIMIFQTFCTFCVLFLFLVCVLCIYRGSRHLAKRPERANALTTLLKPL